MIYFVVNHFLFINPVKVLATRMMEERKTAENIRVIVLGILDEFEASRENNFYVTDNGANIKAAFSDHIWLSCAGHNLNLTVSHALDSKHTEDLPLNSNPSSNAVMGLVQAAKDIVTRIKRTQMQHQLETTLKQVYQTFNN